MTSADLIRTYSYAGDMTAVITSIVLLVVIKVCLYYSNDVYFSYIKRSIHFVLVGAAANVFFAKVCVADPDNVLLIYALRDIYHILVLLSLGIFIMYIRSILSLDGKLTKYGGTITVAVFIIGMICDVISPFTHFGFYRENGLWYDSTFIKPFTMVYIYALVYFAAMFIMYSQRMIRPVRQSLFITEFIAVLVLFYQSINDSNTFASFTFLLPIIVVFILLHSKPFDLVTGAIIGSSYNIFLEHAKKRKVAVDYMILELDTRIMKEVPTELGKTINAFWHRYFREAILFSPHKGTFVLAIMKTRRNGDTEKKINELIHEVFPRYYEKYKIQYKIFSMINVDFIKDLSELEDFINDLGEKAHINSAYDVTEKDIERLKLMGRTKEVLREIEAGQNLNDEHILVYCQPVKNIKTGKYDTAEALMRMQIDGKLIFPDIFIPLAEHAGFIHTLSCIILNKVCLEVKKLSAEGYDFTRISVNFSLLEIGEPNFCADVVEIIGSHDIPFDKIAFELTESQNEHDYRRVVDQIETLKMFGIKVYLDDFGTGYSNFDRILGLGVDVIKFDRSMLLVADENETISYSLKHFSQAFKELEYKILFEGVETEEHEKICLSCGADFLQGYKFSKPIPIDKLRDFFAKEGEA